MTYSLLQTMSFPGGGLTQVLSATGLAEAGLDAETVPIATDTLINLAFPYATIKAYYIIATCSCTLETNATNHAGGDSISLTANVPVVYINGGGQTNLFTADVTKLYLTAAAAGTLTLRVLYDPTP